MWNDGTCLCSYQGLENINFILCFNNCIYYPLFWTINIISDIKDYCYECSIMTGMLYNRFSVGVFGYKRGGKLLIAIFQGGTIASGKKELYNTGIMLFTLTKMTGKYRSCDLHCICLLKELTQLLNWIEYNSGFNRKALSTYKVPALYYRLLLWDTDPFVLEYIITFVEWTHIYYSDLILTCICNKWVN